MKFKNVELRPVTGSLLTLRSERLKVKTALAVTKNLTLLGKADEEYEKTRTSIIEARCLKGDDGKPKLVEVEADQADGTKKKEMTYDFATPEDKAECVAKLNELGQVEVDITLFEITEEDIEKEDRLSPEAVSVLLMFVKKE